MQWQWNIKKLQRKKTPIDKWMLENIEITLRQCVTTVPVSELLVGFLFGWKQRVKTVYWWLQIFLFLVCLCLVCTVCAGVWENRYGVQFQAILPWEHFIPGSVVGAGDDQSNTAGGATIIGIMTFFSYIIILNTLVPISLYVRYQHLSAKIVS